MYKNNQQTSSYDFRFTAFEFIGSRRFNFSLFCLNVIMKNYGLNLNFAIMMTESEQTIGVINYDMVDQTIEKI